MHNHPLHCVHIDQYDMIIIIIETIIVQTRCPTQSQSRWATRSFTYQSSRSDPPSGINENYTSKRQTSTQLQIKVWAKKYTQRNSSKGCLTYYSNLGSDRGLAMQSPISSSSHPLLVLRQQQLASTGIAAIIYFYSPSAFLSSFCHFHLCYIC